MTNQLLDEILTACRPLTSEGKAASYIPELSKADEGMLGLAVAVPGEICHAGEWDMKFTIQSIAKVLVFTCCLLDNPLENVLKKVSFEPSADSFNSIVPLETKNLNKPLNPMINAGAIACMALVKGDTPGDKFRRVLELARQLSGNRTADVNQGVYLSEKRTGSRNRALAYYMQSTGILEGEVEELLDAYFRTCSIEMDCADLARMALVYALGGEDPAGQRYFSREMARMVKAVITLCGMYNESGTVAVTVGLPSKSGVGGGIFSVVPGKMGIGVYGPALNAKGSSIAGLEALRLLSERMDLSIF